MEKKTTAAPRGSRIARCYITLVIASFTWLTWWCLGLIGNGGMGRLLINSYCGSFPHSLLSTSKFSPSVSFFFLYCSWLVVWNMFFFFHSIWDNPSHWLIFFRGVETTRFLLLHLFLCNFSILLASLSLQATPFWRRMCLKMSGSPSSKLRLVLTHILEENWGYYVFIYIHIILYYISYIIYYILYKVYYIYIV